jgi:ribosomal protein S19
VVREGRGLGDFEVHLNGRQVMSVRVREEMVGLACLASTSVHSTIRELLEACQRIERRQVDASRVWRRWKR